MASISVPIDDATLERLEAYARERSLRPEDLLRAYAEYLADAEEPDTGEDDIPVKGIMRLLEMGGSFDWLKDEPDLYSASDGVPYD
ncbi:MAG: hypothetical protein U0837_07210 [Dehalococcoidia bacterium]|jgi:hypothetical protein